MIEVCCGSYEDGVNAYLGGARRIELNSALYLGGCTPSIASLTMLKKNYPDLEVVCMVRPRGAGFHYNDIEIECMKEDAKALLEAKADGIVFGFLNEDFSIDQQTTKYFVDLAHSYHKTAIFHRAFDVLQDVNQGIEILINLGIDRILTSGTYGKAMEGKEVIRHLQECYGNQIEILPGSGINASNAKEMMAYTKVNQVHSSCKVLKQDVTTHNNQVTYDYGNGDYFEAVSIELVKRLCESVNE